jgi:murein DD-endopeptidase MepM/ murein hydrolase activator NlpD
MKNKTIFFISFFLMLLNACSPVADTQEILDQAIDLSTETLVPSATPIPTETIVPPVPTRELISQVCSPLDGLTLYELVNDVEILHQRFETPRPSHDDGHTGVDYSYYRRNNRVGIEGLSIFSALPGTVISVLNNKWPLGHTIIIETPIEDINPELLGAISPPKLEPTVAPAPHLICPPGELEFELSFSKRSIYILYAHLKDQALFNIGDKIDCGQKIGEVGNTGWSSNPHLHFETRIGPSGARFESMAYYTTQATPKEQYSWCIWRVSNLFQLFDPMNLLSGNLQFNNESMEK